MKVSRSSMKARYLILAGLLCISLAGGALLDFIFHKDRKISLSEARIIAEHRFRVHAALSNVSAVEPTVTERDDDFEFVYSDARSGKKIVVLVERNGEFADTITCLDRALADHICANDN